MYVRVCVHVYVHVRVCMYLCVWCEAAVPLWLEHQLADQEVAGLMPSCCCCYVPCARNFTHIAPVHPAVLMGTWQ